jgi:hypothetical protein
MRYALVVVLWCCGVVVRGTFGDACVYLIFPGPFLDSVACFMLRRSVWYTGNIRWDLWSTKWHWSRFFSPSTLVSPVSSVPQTATRPLMVLSPTLSYLDINNVLKLLKRTYCFRLVIFKKNFICCEEQPFNF